MSFPRRFDAIFVDIDDTLWENNIYFLQVHDWLVREARDLGLSGRAADALMHRNEMRNIRLIGYGYDSYEQSLHRTVRQMAAMAGRSERAAALCARASAWCAFLRKHPIKLLRGVREALPALSAEHRLIMFTKGNPRDQLGKVARSGLERFFHAAEVGAHKSPEEYRRLAEKFGVAPERALMVGNSPRSDINNAKRAGFFTAYVPHRKTWYMELEPISPAHPPTLVVERFDLLAAHLLAVGG
ncbi:MAG: HAD family hydrolase [Candidatus Sumerlaeia bacterium]|nr:HAD family hydrolase [Candidatus Sumerlaeia bacterium]